jgi:heme exporter protein C
VSEGRSLHRFANPARFVRIADAVYPWALAGMAICFAVGLYLALFASPADYQQGETVRIMYVHVPSAWMAMFVYASMAVGSASYLIWRHPLGVVSAKAAAPVGAAFTFLALVTGSLWGKPMWGTWWVWDGRLTSVLILFFVYLGYIALINAFENAERGQKAASLLCLVGVINLPIIKFSVDWWNTLHQPASVSRIGTPALHESMLWPLLIMALAFMLYFLCVLIVRIKSELLGARLRALTAASVEGR